MPGQPSDTLAPGTRLGAYEVVRQVGQGGMGVVYEARHAELGGAAAIKVLSAHVLAKDPSAAQRFRQEGRAAARVRHPHVLQVYDVGTSQTPDGAELTYLVMEFLRGESLQALLGREAPLPLPRLCDLMLPVLRGVAAAHAQGVVHRDLKPENLFIEQDETGWPLPKVLDFGIAKLLDTRGHTRAGLIIGTPEFLAPELTGGGALATPRSDQYALGAILYEGATGRLPFPWEEAEPLPAFLFKLLGAPLVPPSAHRPDLPPAFDALVCRALDRQPEARFPSLEAMAQALLPLCSEAGRARYGGPLPRAMSTTVPDPPPPGPHSPPGNGSASSTIQVVPRLPLRGFVMGGLVGLLLLGAGAYWVRKPAPPAPAGAASAGTASAGAASAGAAPTGAAPAPAPVLSEPSAAAPVPNPRIRGKTPHGTIRSGSAQRPNPTPPPRQAAPPAPTVKKDPGGFHIL